MWIDTVTRAAQLGQSSGKVPQSVWHGTHLMSFSSTPVSSRFGTSRQAGLLKSSPGTTSAVSGMDAGRTSRPWVRLALTDGQRAGRRMRVFTPLWKYLALVAVEEGNRVPLRSMYSSLCRRSRFTYQALFRPRQIRHISLSRPHRPIRRRLRRACLGDDWVLDLDWLFCVGLEGGKKGVGVGVARDLNGVDDLLQKKWPRGWNGLLDYWITGWMNKWMLCSELDRRM